VGDLVCRLRISRFSRGLFPYMQWVFAARRPFVPRLCDTLVLPSASPDGVGTPV